MDEIRDFIQKYSFYDTGESENGTECVEMPVSELMRLIGLVEEAQVEKCVNSADYRTEREHGTFEIDRDSIRNAPRVSQQLTED